MPVEQRPPEPPIIELDGPQMAFFDIPLDYWATPNGEIEAEGHPEAARLFQRVVYMNFKVADPARVHAIIDRVTARLRELGGGFIWWRRRPTRTDDTPAAWRLRLGTSPELPSAWWEGLGKELGSVAQFGHPDPRVAHD